MRHIEYVLCNRLKLATKSLSRLQHIVDLIESLDNKRFETIQFTFKQVSLYFTEVFKRLVPEGTAHLVIKKGDNEVSSVFKEEKQWFERELHLFRITIANKFHLKVLANKCPLMILLA